MIHNQSNNQPMRLGGSGKMFEPSRTLLEPSQKIFQPSPAAKIFALNFSTVHNFPATITAEECNACQCSQATCWHCYYTNCCCAHL